MLRVAAEDLGRLAREWFPFSVHLIEGFFQTVRSMDMLTSSGVDGRARHARRRADTS